jgi:hypothetical protein
MNREVKEYLRFIVIEPDSPQAVSIKFRNATKQIAPGTVKVSGCVCA